ncbi:MAG: BMP family ABC transporter substrate-binding protein [Erysipelotrichaceae bacterium]|nr:BMP family ABC transporter substrate-binding protein [Erysipelotrichaceae bacterium]MDY5252678.1 BMP family ABC transporter substrate-binding protein [Erysipelotrichaceae bacterium]
MKKALKLFLALLVSVSLAACSSNSNNEATSTEGTETTSTSGECPVTIGLVTDMGGVDDKSFNQSAWEGVQRFAKENGLENCVSYLQSTTEADYVPNLSTFADEGKDLVMAVGYLFNEAITEVSANYPDTKFLFVDDVVEHDNVESATFNAEQGSFLVGVAAGLTASENGSKKVGFMGGMEGPIIGSFQAGYEQGVLAACPDCKIYVDYADSFADDAKGQQLAAKQYDLGATVIYQAAGNAGNGVIKEAKERGDVWAIGVDKDQYEDGMKDDGTSIILTSMLKRVDSATYSACTDLLNGTFEAGVKVFNLSNDGVGAEVTSGRNLSDDVIAQINDYAEKIKNGEIEVTPEATIANGSSN